MTFDEAFLSLQSTDSQVAAKKWAVQAVQSPPALQAIGVLFDQLDIEPTGDKKKDRAAVAAAIWMITIAFEAGRIHRAAEEREK